MDGSLAQPSPLTLDLTGWKSKVGAVSAAMLAVLFLVAGIWKTTDPARASALVNQALTAQTYIPGSWALPLAVLLGISEILGGVLLLVPRLRRWGALIVALLLVAFMAYFTIFYAQLHGKECNCFPLIKRTVGPAFFIGDAIMLALAGLAARWSRKSEGLQTAAMILGAVVIFAAASYGITVSRQSGIRAPDSITVGGKPYSLQQGRIVLYFFDPECSHCDAAARRMAKWQWGDTRVVGVPTAQPQFGAEFMTSTGLRGVLSNDLAKLRQTFQFVSGPHGVALESGRQIASLDIFDDKEPEATLRRSGFIQ